MAGGRAPITARLQSTPLSASFTGEGTLAPALFLSGAVSAKSASLRNAALWQAVNLPFELPDAPIDIAAELTADHAKWDFQALNLTMGEHSGTGGLTIVPQPGVAAVSGTLEFNTIDLAAIAGPVVRVKFDESVRAMPVSGRLIVLMKSADSTLGPETQPPEALSCRRRPSAK
ncbi:MAG: hypothetical protein HC779_08935 [Phyllobacteriaceae bacterium]|nr:hypothetical protein [Phyllobacteriaceae bacterium]